MEGAIGGTTRLGSQGEAWGRRKSLCSKVNVEEAGVGAPSAIWKGPSKVHTPRGTRGTLERIERNDRGAPGS